MSILATGCLEFISQFFFYFMFCFLQGQIKVFICKRSDHFKTFGSDLHASPHIHIWIRHSTYGYIWIRQYGGVLYMWASMNFMPIFVWYGSLVSTCFHKLNYIYM